MSNESLTDGQAGLAEAFVGGVEASSSPRVIDRVLDALEHHRRRMALEYIRREGAVDVSELADHVASVEEDVSAETATIALHHRHLPKLAAVDVIQYDHETKTANPGDRIELASSFIECAN